jgi:hypothetical protein
VAGHLKGNKLQLFITHGKLGSTQVMKKNCFDTDDTISDLISRFIMKLLLLLQRCAPTPSSGTFAELLLLFASTK